MKKFGFLFRLVDCLKAHLGFIDMTVQSYLMKSLDIKVCAKIWTQMCLESSDVYKPHMVNV